MRRVGTSVRRPDVAAKIDGSFVFSNDVTADDELYGATVRSPHAHARIIDLETSGLAADPEVVCVLSIEDVPGARLVGHIVADQPVFADGVARYHGEPVAFVVATTQEAAWAAADRLVVSYGPLPVLHDPERALDPASPRLRAGGNVVRRAHLRRGGDVSGAPVEVEATFHTARQDQAFLGVESALALPDADGGVTLRLATQDLHTDQHQIAAALDLPLDKVRLEMAGIGGAFGGREDITLQIHLALAATVTGRPVRTTYRRAESFLAHPKRHPARLHYRLGAELDGTLRYVYARILLDGGAYASTSMPVAGSAAYFAAGPYRVPAVDVEATSVCTNNPVSGAMRGFGAVQACFGMESAMDLLAAELGIDPVELRRRNVLAPGDAFPTSGQPVGDAAPLAELIDRCVELPLPQRADPDDPYALPGGTGNTSTAANVRRGVGFALGVKNHLYAEGMQEEATATVVVDATGVEVRSAASEVGQGVVSALAQIASDELGGQEVRVAGAHSDHGYAGSSSASRATFVSGGAVRDAAGEAARLLRARVAQRWSVPEAEVELRPTGVLVRGELLPLAIVIGEEPIAATATFLAPSTERGDEHGQGSVHVSWMFVAHRAVVDVDAQLGLVKVVQVATAQDVGIAVNPRAVRGQLDGGIAQGLGLAVMEHLQSVEGVVANATFTDYLVPTTADMAATEVALVERPDPAGPFGLKGVGEPPVLSSTPAIVAAIRAATGRALTRVPVRPEDIVGTS
ncbi:MAG: carbon-monoxide dehydrogenase large subunit [Ilumatobacteraceae bacterium]|nr:carbon-monoxide dehydrogenase large subunit [Ilumatobacteraceae bacterium]